MIHPFSPFPLFPSSPLPLFSFSPFRSSLNAEGRPVE
jgi:hypothetical protein